MIFGTSGLARKIALELHARADRREPLLGVVSEAFGILPTGFPCTHLGSVADLPAIIASTSPQRVVVALDNAYQHLPADRLIEAQASERIMVETGTDAFERLTGKLAIEALPGSTILFSGAFRPRTTALVFGRLFSIVGAVLGLLITLPLVPLMAVAIRLDSPGPILFVQERIGFGGRKFNLLKFRSMSAEQAKYSEWVGDNEGTITRVGRLLRKFRLDEIPQFINVILGDMNLVGPRPHPESNRQLFVLVARNAAQCGDQIPYYSLRQTIRPGITGWAQVRYKYANGLNEEIEKLRYDLYYIKHCSAWLDLRILFETIKVVLVGHAHGRATQQSAYGSGAADAGGAGPDARDARSEAAPSASIARIQPSTKLRWMRSRDGDRPVGRDAERGRYSNK